ncbi:MAG TPA: hypothetical protein VLF20_04780 [Patescibacteria group bacterium]|nr:hypothetical protein [Patescibacteria group bacterium]
MTTEPQSRFIFSGHTWNPEKRMASFSYNISYKGEAFDFTETLTFPTDRGLSDVPEALFNTILDNLSLVLGISYYKLFLPKEIILENIVLNKEQAEFWNTVYTKGLGEFFYQNQLDFRGLISFPVSTYGSKPLAFPRQNRSLVGIGGGKDSIVTGELLKQQKKSFTSFVVNQHLIRDEVISLLGGESLVVRRELDPLLFTLNKRNDTYNGHIPVSAQYAFIGVLLGALYDYRFVIVSNEQSSNYGNVEYHGIEINHQWSKSFEFEQLFQNYVRTFITPDITYFSFLRPLTELAIAKEFVNYPQYFTHFSSCNRNFRIDGSGNMKRWCGECAKCAFAFVMLAAFLSKEDILTIFGEDFFAKETLLRIYQELLGVVNIKPFDCVGTPDEVIVAFYLASKKGKYQDTRAMQFFEQDVLSKVADIDALQQHVFAQSSEHAIPEEFLGINK